jgi:hypothetical protein
MDRLSPTDVWFIDIFYINYIKYMNGSGWID